MTLKRPPHLSLDGFFDADWASDRDDLRSMIGYSIFLGCNAVAWSSKKQHIVSRFCTEVKYRSLANATGEVI